MGKKEKIVKKIITEEKTTEEKLVEETIIEEKITEEKITVDTRLGEQQIEPSKIIYFPKGIIGFENMHEFTLLKIKENAPMLILQSMSEPTLGLLVTNPYTFLSDYSIQVGDVEQQLLCLKEPSDATVLVTLSIPHGKPHLTSLSLTGPILINAQKRLGLQVPQPDKTPSHVLLKSLIDTTTDTTDEDENNKNKEQNKDIE